MSRADHVSIRHGIKKHHTEGLCVVITEFKPATKEARESWYRRGEPVPFEIRNTKVSKA